MYLQVPLQKAPGKFSELYLCNVAQRTRWIYSSVRRDHNEILTLGDVCFEDDIMEAKSLLNNAVSYGMVGYLESNRDNNSKNYYLLLLPHPYNASVEEYLLLIRRHHKCTKTINNKLGSIALEKLNEKIVFGGETYTFYSVVNSMEIFGHTKGSTEEAKLIHYNNSLTGRQEVRVCSEKSKRRREGRQKSHSKKHLNSLSLRPATISRFAELAKDYAPTVPMPKHFGIRSTDCGGMVPVLPFTGNSDSEEELPPPLSEYHTIKEIDHVFNGRHNLSTIAHAIDNLSKKIDTTELDKDLSKELVIGAVASKFFEDISFQIDCEESQEHTFRSIKADIDQVAVTITQLELRPFSSPESPNSTMAILCATFKEKVLLGREDLSYGIVRLTYQKFASSVHQGGHTYMDRSLRKKYISIYNEGAMVSVLRVSVRYHDKKTHEEHVQATWNGMLFVAGWLEKHGPNVSAQKSTIWTLDGDSTGYEHNVCSGPLFAYLTCAYLASVTDGGITIASETFGTKELASVPFTLSVKTNVINDIEAQRIVTELTRLLQYSAPSIIARTAVFFEEISQSPLLAKKDISTEGFILIWGIGCTVETELVNNAECAADYSDEVHHEPVRDFAGSNDLPSYFLLPNWHRSVSKRGLPAYTVIQVELPPYAACKHNPSEWFTDPRSTDSTVGADSDTDNDGEYPSDDEFNNSVLFPPIQQSSVGAQNHGDDLHRNIVVSSRSHVTYPGLGGILPFEMQPITITPKRNQRNLHFNGMVSQCCTRFMHYTVCGRMASGETGRQCTKKSHEMGHVDLDLRLTAEGGVFNIAKCLERKEDFLHCANSTLNFLELNGTAGRIEVAYTSTTLKECYPTLLLGVQDTVSLCLTHTKSYSPYPIVKVARFALLGILAKLEIVARMMSCKHPTGAVYEELINVRLEVAALLFTFWSGKGKLRQTTLIAPKNAHMACRPIFRRLHTYCEQSRENILKTALLDFYEEFQCALMYIDGRAHNRIESKIFLPVIRHGYGTAHKPPKEPGHACDRCYKLFTSSAALNSFDTHSCKAPNAGQFGSKGGLISMTSKKFKTYYDDLVDRLDQSQSVLLKMLQHARKSGSQLLLFVTGYAGTGKSMTMTCAIIQEIIAGGMKSAEVVAPTKVGANVVDGKTLHSLLKLMPQNFLALGCNTAESERLKHIRQQAELHVQRLHLIDAQRAIEFTMQLETLFIDECGMVSHDMFEFLNHFFRKMRNSKKAFGGLNIILCGDVLQLPPIIENDSNLTKNGSGTRQKIYFFESKSFLKSGFQVLFLKKNYRQSTDSYERFIAVLNRMRDGQCTEEDCAFLNNDCGHAVNRNSTDKVLRALIGNFNKEMITYREEHETNIGHNLVYNSKLRKLLYKVDYCWSKHLLAKHVEECYIGEGIDRKHKNESGEIFYASTLCKAYEVHVGKLGFVEDIEDDFVICNENVEINAISAAYQNGKICVTVTAIDVAVGASISCTNEPDFVEVTDDMKAHAAEETKLNNILLLRTGQKVFITMNGLDQFIANNSMVEIVKFVTINDCIEEVHVKPVLSDKTLEPHITVLKRLSREVSYKAASIEVLLTRSQFPIKPADGGSLFTAQGISLNQPYIVNMQRLSHSGYGKAYVAYSRAVNPSLVLSLHPISVQDVMADPLALGFDLIHRESSTDSNPVSHVNYDWARLESEMKVCMTAAKARKKNNNNRKQ